MDAQAAAPPAAPAVPATKPRPWAPLVVGAMTLALTLYLSFQSSELHTVERVLREHEAIAGEQPRQKLYQAWKKIRHEKALGSAGAPMDEVQRLIDAGRDLVDKRGAVQDELLQAQALHLVPPQLLAGPQALLQALMPAAQAAGAAAPDMAGGSAAASTAADATPAAVCPAAAPAAPPAAGAKARAARSPQEDLTAHQQEFSCFLQALGIVAGEFDYPTWGAVFAARDKVTLLVSWLLPGLYGLLGACFFLMRTMLQTGRERLPGSGRALAAVDILLRMAAGGLAGIIIGWFAVPASGGVPLGGVSSLSFGLAFLAGFSTDALFTLLDGVLRGLGNRERDDTAPRPGPA